MRRSLRQKIVAFALAPALFLSGAAQALVLFRCDAAAMHACCSPERKSQAPAAKLAATVRMCCADVSAPAAPDQAEPGSFAAHAAPAVHVATTAVPAAVAQVLPPSGGHLDPPRPSLVIVNRALLI